MSDRVRTVDMSDPVVVLDCYRKLNVAYKELKAENEKLAALSAKASQEASQLRAAQEQLGLFLVKINGRGYYVPEPVLREIGELLAALNSIEAYVKGRFIAHRDIAELAESSTSGKKQRVRLSEASDILGKIRAAAAALKETGDE